MKIPQLKKAYMDLKGSMEEADEYLDTEKFSHGMHTACVTLSTDANDMLRTLEDFQVDIKDELSHAVSREKEAKGDDTILCAYWQGRRDALKKILGLRIKT